MPHQNTSSSTATSQNAATEPVAPRDQATGQGPRPEPKTYADADVSRSSLAPPAAGEVADAMDEGDATGETATQQGTTNANRPERTEKKDSQGSKTVQKNREQVRGED